MRFTGMLISFLFVAFISAQAQAAILPVSATYADVKTFMKGLADQYPATTQLFDLALSDSGDTIQGLKIGKGPIADLVVATHHGNEFASTEVAKNFALSIAQSPLSGITMYVIPVLNISGFNARNRYESLDGDSIDPNRDYPGPCGTSGPFKLKSTAALAKFIADHGIVASATLHTFSPLVLYPWGISTKDVDTLFTDLFKQLGAAATVESKYPVGNSTAALYPADGTFEDYSFWQHGIWSMLFEIGYSHDPSDVALEESVQGNVPGLRRMFEQAPRARADHHDFTGKCDTRLKGLDLRLE